MVQALAGVDPSSKVAERFRPLLNAFNALQLLGLIGSVLCLISARFSSVPRQAPWWNFMVLFCTSYLLLFFAGQVFDSAPDLPLCILQSSLTYAVSPLAEATALGLVVQLLFNVRRTLSGQTIRGERYWRIVLLIMPYAIFVVLILESTVISLNIPDAKFSSVSYCSLEDHAPGQVTSALDVILAISIVVLNIIIALQFRKHWSMLRSGNFTSMFVRVSAFTLFGLVAMIIGVLFFTSADSSSEAALLELDIILAIIPVAAVFIFGTHKDLLVVWFFWQKHNVFPLGTREKPLPLVPARELHVEYVIDIQCT
ncbi:hypothetical protein BT96DRAFT_1026373 [Gymnopus androsaceus JB14]|uniref:G-protein coupled receptors family 3 profile domain-containing protein n=1 Tax=Gymnopus androsaceus JB14 TaxID=1447944 RepID=A0A6A4GL09_9AGAR|nr:hypothetical protein BT96DRAFT_1026373 [Gymnopus androsaceus JB14]